MTDSDVCLVCSAAADSWRHALIECTMAKSVWSLVDDELVEHMIACRHDDARLWLVELQDSMDNESFVKMLVTLWSIWWARRQAIHEDKFQSPLTTFSFITGYLSDLAEVSRKQQGRVLGPKAETKWKAPPSGVLKIYVDAAVGRHEDGGAIAAICRDEAGIYLGASAVQIPDLIDPEVLEAMATNEGLSLASDLACNNAVIATDCITTVSHMNEGYLGNSAAIIQEIKRRMQLHQWRSSMRTEA